MEFYYDIKLNFNDYPINYYDWNKTDNVERVIRIPIIRVDDLSYFIKSVSMIDTDHNMIIVSDGINSIALELIDKKVIYFSSLSYKDELRTSKIASNMSITNLKLTFNSNRSFDSEMRQINKIKKIILSNSDKYYLKYIYYFITNKDNDDIKYIKSFLKDDINNNFSNKYLKLYDLLYN